MCGDPSKPLAATQRLKVAFPLGNRGVVRSQEGDGGGKRRKQGRANRLSVAQGK